MSFPCIVFNGGEYEAGPVVVVGFFSGEGGGVFFVIKTLASGTVNIRTTSSITSATTDYIKQLYITFALTNSISIVKHIIILYLVSNYNSGFHRVPINKSSLKDSLAEQRALNN